jgi:hypothetical protein
VKIKLYIEGGGDSHLQDVQFRAGWRAFFEKAGLTARMPATFRGGGREQTFRAFQTALKKRKPGELPLLLVDSEELVTAGRTAWEHLQGRERWEQPPGAGDDDALLMICCMETWFVADRAALAKFFGQEWRENVLPQWPNLEEITKEQVLAALDKATAGCGWKRYAKGNRSFNLLATVRPDEVAKHCPAAQRLLDRLRGA